MSIGHNMLLYKESQVSWWDVKEPKQINDGVEKTRLIGLGLEELELKVSNNSSVEELGWTLGMIVGIRPLSNGILTFWI